MNIHYFLLSDDFDKVHNFIENHCFLFFFNKKKRCFSSRAALNTVTGCNYFVFFVYTDSVHKQFLLLFSVCLPIYTRESVFYYLRPGYTRKVYYTIYVSYTIFDRKERKKETYILVQGVTTNHVHVRPLRVTNFLRKLPFSSVH